MAKHAVRIECECKDITESVLVPLARHYTAAGDTARAFYYLLECAAAYLRSYNSYMVSPLRASTHRAWSPPSCLALGRTASPLRSGMPWRGLGGATLGSGPGFFLWFASSAARDAGHCALSTRGLSREAV